MTLRVSIIFEGDLNRLLPLDKRNIPTALEVTFPGKRSVKDLIQSLRVPHTEVGVIRVNGQRVDFSYILRGDDVIKVLPVPPHSRDPKGNPPRFLCDVHLRKLARRLRLLGFDTAIDPRWDDPQLADISQKENRVLLSRDRGLLMRNRVTQGRLIRNTDPERQVREVLQHFDIPGQVRPFTRCTLCNGNLERVLVESQAFKETLAAKIPPKVLCWCDEFHHCASCEKVFWKGSHYRKLTEMVRKYTL
ncbi:MAG: twitching motility protein PilT [bacterium]|nr:twitching motility protein PilT [bacterium]